ncbi:Crp/Fnr family transcriptional regulator [Bradyrhizobium centrosematis]|uniref:Crp/Fnr family transcriptional regulator n=1 Tax=Bradyrhizobium centrosematis TaxID=1300039 RepID=UPI0021698DDF|nr:Crp/Fnr family transcriptional regulator [Bradyrhizobium centrosematis]MCS3758696.1 CRP-like cAMP-binding protein [Bradyrhizobium centrosematis]MCS3773416.1 CRP-like cAMP-binding protein [Bradyrhizobium centrosematis]
MSNDLIRRLPDRSRSLLVGRCDDVTLKPRQMLQERNLPLQYAYFPEQGAASLTAKAGDCLPVEIQTVGAKDFIGIPLILGMRISPHRCMVQVPGSALRIEADALIELVKTDVEIEKLLLRYVQATLIQSSQLTACNSRHSLQQRLARWLLVAEDKLSSHDIPLTHRCIAQALGVRRAGITSTMGAMEARGIIKQGRAQFEILDRARLEELSCNCHRVILSAYDNSLNAANTRPGISS